MHRHKSDCCFFCGEFVYVFICFLSTSCAFTSSSLNDKCEIKCFLCSDFAALLKSDRSRIKDFKDEMTYMTCVIHFEHNGLPMKLSCKLDPPHKASLFPAQYVTTVYNTACLP